jgi:hypothetical protein
LKIISIIIEINVTEGGESYTNACGKVIRNTQNTGPSMQKSAD